MATSQTRAKRIPMTNQQFTNQKFLERFPRQRRPPSHGDVVHALALARVTVAVALAKVQILQIDRVHKLYVNRGWMGGFAVGDWLVIGW